MEFRLAVLNDLVQIKDMYRQIVKSMNENNIQIWDDIYPCVFFENDIKNNQMYLLIDNNEIISAFVLCNTNAGEKEVRWSHDAGKSIYFDRLGVNIKYSNKGIGSLMIDKAKEIAKSLGCEYLRLFVVDINIPAIKFYIKNGFEKADGMYDEVFDDGFVLHEYGYEIKI
ncbi:GNAT family N-acetyltransferase [Thomasclavelia cocleata]|jgi:ribosomal protein S18 acetylase RimI-like enzyme|uniref:GNAT family N-acetyltransferase n=1 Tax=Thomasclavelia cocleata TaxID=69824 RepID=UPI00241E259D|nr:GNAT family N-acetyltransferase [Thomasclavelia cocleata]